MASKPSERIKRLLLDEITRSQMTLALAEVKRADNLAEYAEDAKNAVENLAYFNSLEVPDGR